MQHQVETRNGADLLLMKRRRFLASSLVAAAPLVRGVTPPLPRVAAINSIYRFKSHAYHIAGRFIHGYHRGGELHRPPFQLVRIYNDQSPPDDLGPEVCREHGIELSRDVAGALGGAASLDVDAVLLIIEHGDYPVNQLGQVEYPRYEHFEEILKVFRVSGRSVPVFVDKHLSYDHEKAARMVAASRELGFGLMAGSSLPVVWRVPELLPPLETPFREGLVCFGFERATPEIYLFHALEALQCQLERRKGGETGVQRVTFLEGGAVWKAADEGKWSPALLEAALRVNPSRNYGTVRGQVRKPQAILIEYRDGTRGTVLNLVEAVSDFSFAGSVEGRPEPLATWYVLPAPPGARFFDALTWNIESFFASGKPPYPVERTLLTGTLLDFAMHSLARGESMSGAALAIQYRPPQDDGHLRGDFVGG